MKFAVNYSAPLIQLLKANAVHIDLIKCPDWAGMLKEAEPYRPITIHYDMDAGFGHTFNCDFSRIIDLKNSTFTPHINTHLVTPRHFNPHHQTELQKINTLWREEIQFMINHVGAEAVALEHFPFTTTTPNIRPAADSQIFSEVIADTGCMLLLDLAHARITADTLNIDVKDYIRALPLDRLVEMHVTGIKPFGGILTDHFAMDEADWNLLSWALKEIKAGSWRKPEIVAFEYGGVGKTFVWRTDIDVIRTQVPKLYEMVHAQSSDQPS
jgi:uncharacterized protein